MTYQQPPQPPQEPPQPPQQPYYPPQQPYPSQQQFSTTPPEPPKKSSKVWLYVVLGIVGLCVICGILGAIAMAAGGNYISKNIDQITGKLTEVAPTVESFATSAVIDTPEPAVTAEPAKPEGNNPPVPEASGIITEVTMAKNVKGAQMEPQDPTNVFASKDTFHAVANIKDAPANTNFKATWYAVDVGSAADPNTVIDSTEITSDGTRYLDFNLTPNSGWPTGTYRVEISVNGKLDQVVEFSVE